VSAAAPLPKSAAAAPLLSVENASIAFAGRRGAVRLEITRDISFEIGRGERVGLVGESGCGKSVTGLSLMRLLPPNARVGGRMLLDGQDLNALSPRAMRQVRGRRISMIFQEPMSALDPVFTIGSQIGEALTAHGPVPAAELRDRVIAALVEVGIPAPETRIDDYPHQLSGGMRQRVMIAMAVICRPELIIADEPTTALDVTIQAQIMDLLVRLCEDTGAALLFITHDLGVVAETCTRMITMYAGEVVEDAPVDAALTRPLHPYTSGLLRALPQFNRARGAFAFIAGRVPSPAAMPGGCRFMARCGHAAPACANAQALLAAGPERRVRCARADALTLPGAVA
jgi:peptide/nickel transport system ATP-binding protein